MYLGIDQQSGFVYEGFGSAEFPAVPTPSVTQAKLIEAPQDWASLPSGLFHSPFSWVFREDSFDAVSRTRRGRLYESMSGQTQPSAQAVAPHPYEDPLRRAVGQGGRINKSLFVYTACASLLAKSGQGNGLMLALGTPRAASAWRIVQTEVLANGCVMVTLKSLSAFGILPDIDTAQIPQEFRDSIAQAIGRALDSAFRETPISVVDHCRNALTILLSRWLVAQGHNRSILAKDLGNVATTIAQPPYEKACVSWLAQLVARLHVRGKGNEVHSRNLREPIEEDAELALHALGFALREIGWAV
ncbi:hypothetical protein [Burkholderia vietnamiensis]|uniref:hypothetical protein n=1 Tax=Burkholderia vietnamiensis TaxID=60552 RepID=UPI000751B703|nr:hypothetical protein [Burkholderia vietnamiensis]KVE11546.1 hypothetical protein WI92_18415 [Burkholderia vietnamiensis]MDN8071475.1 hypothetical protein [Burkholderia vietnamiensis]